jgi:hypothetical protein
MQLVDTPRFCSAAARSLRIHALRVPDDTTTFVHQSRTKALMEVGVVHCEAKTVNLAGKSRSQRFH